MQCCEEQVSTFRDLGYCTLEDVNGSVKLILSEDLGDSCDDTAVSVFSLIRRATQTEWQSSIRKGAQQWSKEPDTR